jgi:hypothetical protein
MSQWGWLEWLLVVWEWLLVVLTILTLAAVTIGAVKGFTFGKVLRLYRWAWHHPFERPPDDI